MTTEIYNPDLKEAFEYEKAEIEANLEDLMAQFLDASSKNGESTLDEMKIRRLAFAVKYLEEEVEKLKRLKAAVVAEWDHRISEKNKNIAEIKDIIRGYLKEHNNGKSLKLDIGTLSLRSKKPNITNVDAKKLRAYLAERGDLANFLKPGELNVTLAKNELLRKLDSKELTVDEISEFGTYEPEDKSLSIKFK